MQKSDNVERAHLLVEMARVAEQLEENGKALSLYDDALAQFSPESVDPFLPDVLRWKGTLHREKGETDAAFRCYTLSLEKAREAGSERAEAHALNCLGTVAQRRCDHKECERLYERASELALKCGESRLLGMIEQNRGVLASMRGEYAQAAAFYTNSLGAFEMACDAEPMSWVLNNLGILHTKIRNFGEARDYLERGLAIAVNRSDTVVENVIRLNLAEVWMGLGSLDTADECCGDALDQAQKRGDHLTAAGALKAVPLLARGCCTARSLVFLALAGAPRVATPRDEPPSGLSRRHDQKQAYNRIEGGRVFCRKGKHRSRQARRA